MHITCMWFLFYSVCVQVGELESQIDNFEAELEGLTVKKGKTRPPRLVKRIKRLPFGWGIVICDYWSFLVFLFCQTHLEQSISRHKSHIKKLELLLRLLDNDELSPEQVNDIRDFLEDYVERNQVCGYIKFYFDSPLFILQNIYVTSIVGMYFFQFVSLTVCFSVRLQISLTFLYLY